MMKVLVKRLGTIKEWETIQIIEEKSNGLFIMNGKYLSLDDWPDVGQVFYTCSFKRKTKYELLEIVLDT